MYDKLIKITQYKYPQNFVEIFINMINDYTKYKMYMVQMPTLPCLPNMKISWTGFALP